ncbi:MAG: ABC transporter transmembrane domain-containing protein, partial [Planctomycetota bacterium]
MKHFRHAIWKSLKYKWTIVGSVLSSLAIAVLFCISISTVFPVVKIVLEGETATLWIDNQIADSKTDIEEIVTAIREHESAQDNAKDPNEIRRLQTLIDLKEDRLSGLEDKRVWYEKIKPYAERYAPKDPFMTLVAAMIFLLITAVIKGVMLVLSAVLVARISNRTVYDMRRIYYRKALELDQRRIEHLGTSTMMTHLSNNMNMISGGLRVLYGKSLREPFKMIGCLISAAMISLPLLLVSLIVIPAGAIVINGLSRRMKKSVQSELGGMAEVFQTLIESLSWLKTVRIFNREATER